MPGVFLFEQTSTTEQLLGVAGDDVVERLLIGGFGRSNHSDEAFKVFIAGARDEFIIKQSTDRVSASVVQVGNIQRQNFNHFGGWQVFRVCGLNSAILQISEAQFALLIHWRYVQGFFKPVCFAMPTMQWVTWHGFTQARREKIFVVQRKGFKVLLRAKMFYVTGGCFYLSAAITAE